LVPPNGIRASEATRALMKQAPEVMRRPTATAASMLALHTLAPSPKGVSLATATASSASATVMIAATGPNTSWA
jgi:hypothetical protein